ncbi:hypothetical protein JCM8547_001362 [Rhodosporidiobolus lusitaniae]
MPHALNLTLSSEDEPLIETFRTPQAGPSSARRVQSMSGNDEERWKRQKVPPGSTAAELGAREEPSGTSDLKATKKASGRPSSLVSTPSMRKGKGKEKEVEEAGDDGLADGGEWDKDIELDEEKVVVEEPIAELAFLKQTVLPFVLEAVTVTTFDEVSFTLSPNKTVITTWASVGFMYVVASNAHLHRAYSSVLPAYRAGKLKSTKLTLQDVSTGQEMDSPAANDGLV